MTTPTMDDAARMMLKLIGLINSPGVDPDGADATLREATAMVKRLEPQKCQPPEQAGRAPVTFHWVDNINQPGNFGVYEWVANFTSPGGLWYQPGRSESLSPELAHSLGLRWIEEVRRPTPGAAAAPTPGAAEPIPLAVVGMTSAHSRVSLGIVRSHRLPNAVELYLPHSVSEPVILCDGQSIKIGWRRGGELTIGQPMPPLNPPRK
jgi:hypothetical protein